VLLMMQNIFKRQREANKWCSSWSIWNNTTLDPAHGGRTSRGNTNGYVRTVDTSAPKHGGSEAMPTSKLEVDPS